MPINRLWSKWWNGVFEIRLQKDLGHCHALIPLLSPCLFWQKSAVTLWAFGEAQVGRSWGRPLAMAHKGTEAFIQEPMRNWMLPTTTWVSMEVDPPPVKPWDNSSSGWHLDYKLARELQTENPIKPCPESWPTLSVTK